MNKGNNLNGNLMKSKSESIPKYCVYKHSPVLRFLFISENYQGFLLRTFLIIIIPYLLCILVCYREDALIIPGYIIGILQDYGFFSMIVVSILLIILGKVFFDRFPQTFLGSANDLDKNSGLPKAIDFSEGYDKIYLNEIDKQIDFIEGKTRQAKIGRSAIYIVLLFLMLHTFGYEAFIKSQTSEYNVWGLYPSEYRLSYLSLLIFDSCLFFILVPPGLWRIIGIIFSCNKILTKLTNDNRLKLSLISPSGAGGLNSLGRLSIIPMYIVFLPLIPASAMIYMAGFNDYWAIFLPIYTGLLIFVFFYPLRSAHKAMEIAKEKQLGKISALFGDLYNNRFSVAAQNIGKGSEEELLKLSKEFQCLDLLHEKAEKMPVWPIDLTTVKRFSSVIIWPIIGLIIQGVSNADKIISFFNKIKGIMH